MSDIYHDYQDTLNKANQLTEKADKLNDILNNKIEPLMQEVQSCWHGDAATEMMAKLNRLSCRVYNEQSKLRTEADRMRSAAKVWYEAEKAAQEALERARKAAEAAAKVVTNPVGAIAGALSK